MVDDWTEHEVERVIDVYFAMLDLELAGTPYSKSEFRKPLIDEIGRSVGAVEYKLQNISAILDELDVTFIDGYKPATNAQQLLRDRVRLRLESGTQVKPRGNARLLSTQARAVDQGRTMATKSDLQAWVVEALRALGGSAGVVAVCREIWQRHEADLRASGDLFYTWQYDVRWAAQKLRDAGVLHPVHGDRRGNWTLA